MEYIVIIIFAICFISAAYYREVEHSSLERQREDEEEDRKHYEKYNPSYLDIYNNEELLLQRIPSSKIVDAIISLDRSLDPTTNLNIRILPFNTELKTEEKEKTSNADPNKTELNKIEIPISMIEKIKKEPGSIGEIIIRDKYGRELRRESFYNVSEANSFVERFKNTPNNEDSSYSISFY